MIYSVGYAGKTIDTFIQQLMKHGVTILADVRSAPGSRAFPAFNRNALAKSLEKAGIGYRWMGRELGPRSPNPEHYDEHGQVQFDRLRKSASFEQGLKELDRKSNTGQSVACLCAEKWPETCHRSLLIGEALHDVGLQMTHILHDGTLESHQAMRARVAANQGSLFPEENLAIEKLIEKHAYRKFPTTPSPDR